MNRADEPAERHLADDVLHALVRGVLAALVVHQQEDARDDLHEEQEHGHTAEEIPALKVRADRDLLVAHEGHKVVELEAFVEPVPGALEHCSRERR